MDNERLFEEIFPEPKSPGNGSTEPFCTRRTLSDLRHTYTCMSIAAKSAFKEFSIHSAQRKLAKKKLRTTKAGFPRRFAAARSHPSLPGVSWRGSRCLTLVLEYRNVSVGLAPMLLLLIPRGHTDMRALQKILRNLVGRKSTMQHRCSGLLSRSLSEARESCTSDHVECCANLHLQETEENRAVLLGVRGTRRNSVVLRTNRRL